MAESLTYQNWATVQPRYGEIEGISVDIEDDEVTVTASVTVENHFLLILGLGETTLARRLSRRRVVGPNHCMVALGQSNMNGKGALEFNSNSIVNVPNCTIYSNSTRTDALYSASNASITAHAMCVAGQADDDGNPASPLHRPKTVSRSTIPSPTSRFRLSAPNHTNKVEYDLGSNGTAHINPGVYCGSELLVKGSSSTNAIATFHSGEYIIKGGLLKFDSSVKIVDDGGDGVLFQFHQRRAFGHQQQCRGEPLGAQDRTARRAYCSSRIRALRRTISTSSTATPSPTLDGAIYSACWAPSHGQQPTLNSSSLEHALVAYSFNINSNFKINLTADFDGLSSGGGGDW